MLIDKHIEIMMQDLRRAEESLNDSLHYKALEFAIKRFACGVESDILDIREKKQKVLEILEKVRFTGKPAATEKLEQAIKESLKECEEKRREQRCSKTADDLMKIIDEIGKLESCEEPQ